MAVAEREAKVLLIEEPQGFLLRNPQPFRDTSKAPKDVCLLLSKRGGNTYAPSLITTSKIRVVTN